jgi:acetyl-CoA carboxylase biotin carboxylase subunit
MSIKKVFVANRGEIAVRIIRAAQELGMKSVLGCSEVDRDSLAARLADETIVIGPAPAQKSYLDIAAVVQAAIASGADAVHPGYGFLSENSAFAQAVTDAGLIFVGPSAGTISMMGDKARARACAADAGVPTVPGSAGVVEGVDAAVQEAAKIGYPLMLKASAGGGGKGIRIASNESELISEFTVATREASAAFGNGGIYLERFISKSRHVEVQILGDGKRAIHLHDRDCSLQRRRQKLVEEAPAPGLSDSIRERMGTAAVRLAETVDYSGAGTIEFLFDAATEEFFFIEMNTRIQVEHPVTEMVTGIDLVRETLNIAGGQSLRFQQSDVQVRGVAIECRINAEDPIRNFLPNPGTVSGLTFPSGPGVRVDSSLYAGLKIPPFYDSLLAKLIVWDESREAAIARMQRALGELNIEGLKTTRDLHRVLMSDAGFLAASYHTAYLEARLPELLRALDMKAPVPA